MTTFSENWTTYSVSGNSLADVAAAISHLPEAGECSWAPSYTYQAGNDGLLTSAAVTCPFTIQTPAWAERANASNDAGAEWDRWLAALVEHEQGHVTEATAVFDGLDERMVGLSANDAQALFDQACTDAQKASNDYDQLTDHGLNTGTVMDTSIE